MEEPWIQISHICIRVESRVVSFDGFYLMIHPRISLLLWLSPFLFWIFFSLYLFFFLFFSFDEFVFQPNFLIFICSTFEKLASLESFFLKISEPSFDLKIDWAKVKVDREATQVSVLHFRLDKGSKQVFFVNSNAFKYQTAAITGKLKIFNSFWKCCQLMKS